MKYDDIFIKKSIQAELTRLSKEWDVPRPTVSFVERKRSYYYSSDNHIDIGMVGARKRVLAEYDEWEYEHIKPLLAPRPAEGTPALYHLARHEFAHHLKYEMFGDESPNESSHGERFIAILWELMEDGN